MSETRGANAQEVAEVRLSGRNKELTLKAGVVGEQVLFEGDILLGTRESLGLAPDTYRAAVVADAGKLWPGGVVPYTVSASLTGDARVLEAIEHWQTRTPIRFVPWTPENAFEYEGWVSFEDDTDCYSAVGRTGTKQVLSLGPNCSVGNAIHEIGHAVGLWHEQSREDRNQHVRIREENILDDREYNFDQEIDDGDDVGPYDFGSIMHYGPTSFTRNGQPTIEPLQPLPAGVVMGQRSALSDGDINAIRLLYPGND